ncbi:MAG: hypothetical protein AAF772_12045, partial [Acidobacteriota bacterium]
VTRFLSGTHLAELTQLDAATLAPVATVPIRKFGGDDHRDTTASGKGVMNYLADVAIAPISERAWVPGIKANSDRGTLSGEDLDSDNSVRTIAARLDLGDAGGGGATLAGAIDLDNSDSASAVAFSPLGDYALVALQGNNELLVLDALEIDQVSGFGSLVTRLGVGSAPRGVCVDAPTHRIFVDNFLGRSVTVLEGDDFFRTGNKAIAGVEVMTAAGEVLAPDVLAGKRIFYHAGDPRMSAEGYISCASCHVDGGHDGRVWDFTGRGEGLRNTTDLRGRGGTAHGNVHWSANFDEIHDFEHDIRGAFGGLGFLSDPDFAATGQPLGLPKAGLSADLDALATYVDSLDASHLPRAPRRAPDGGLTAAGLNGARVFDALGCGGCHVRPRFTDSVVGQALGALVMHDVGTLRTTSGSRLGGALPGIDTPSLLGAWHGAPYLHDGAAPTLDDVFRVAGGQVWPAEDGVPSGGASLVDNYVDLNNDDTVHGRAYVGLSQDTATLTWTGIDGGAGGTGAIEVRYSASSAMPLRVEVNGVAHTLVLPPLPNVPGWRHVHWGHARLEGVALQPGATNVVSLTPDNVQWPNVSLDEMLVSTADDVALASAHRSADALTTAERDALIAFIEQLDGGPVPAANSVLFADGFESAASDAWSATVD